MKQRQVLTKLVANVITIAYFSAGSLIYDANVLCDFKGDVSSSVHMLGPCVVPSF